MQTSYSIVILDDKILLIFGNHFRDVVLVEGGMLEILFSSMPQ